MVRSRTNWATWASEYWTPPYQAYPSTGPTGTGSYQQLVKQHDLLISGGNHGHAIRRGLNRNDYDRGGNFLVEKYDYYDDLVAEGNLHYSKSTNPLAAGSPHYYGRQYPWRSAWNVSHFPSSIASSDAALNALGATAIARTLPTKPEADLGTFLGEARQGLPHAMLIASTGQSRTRRAMNAGDEYLNVEFGWAPLVRDVKSFAQAVVDSEKRLQQYRNGSGKLIKRRYEFPTEYSVTESLGQANYPVPLMAGALLGSNPRPLLKTTTTKKVERWFSASYIYYTPLAHPSGGSHVAKAQYLLGARLTPSTLWNLAPWSWAADWISNTGDIADNLTAIFQDGLVIHHAYIMERSSHEVKYWMEVQNTWKTYPVHKVISQTFVRTTKKRLRATPYGFGLSWNGFSSSQLAILASLGLTKV